MLGMGVRGRSTLNRSSSAWSQRRTADGPTSLGRLLSTVVLSWYLQGLGLLGQALRLRLHGPLAGLQFQNKICLLDLRFEQQIQFLNLPVGSGQLGRKSFVLSLQVST